MTDNPPNFDQSAVSFAQTVLFQALVVELVESKVLTVESAQRVFDLALKRTGKVTDVLPEAQKFVQHVHDNMKWDNLYFWSAQEKGKKSPGENG